MNTPAAPVVRYPKEILERKPFDGPVIEPIDLFDVHGRHIVVNQVVEGGKPTNLLRYTILSVFEIDIPGEPEPRRYEITCPMNGFKGGRKQAFELHDKFLEEYRVQFEKDIREKYAAAMKMKEAAEAAAAVGKTEKKPESAILGADGQAAGGRQIEIPSHDPTLAERHVSKDGPAKVSIARP